MKSNLVLIAAEFPFGKSETFLETELPILAKSFKKITIIPTEPIEGLGLRAIPANCVIDPFSLSLSKSQKLFSLFSFFSSFYRSEKRIIEKVYKKLLTSRIRKTMFVSLKRGSILSSYLKCKYSASDTIFYSYWCNDSALGLALLKASDSNFRTVTRVHGWDLYFEASKIGYLPFRHFIQENLDLLCPISKKGFEYIREIWKVNSMQNVQVHRLGVKEQVQVIPDPEKFKIVSVSNVIPLKRVDLIAKALSTIQDFEIEWTHFGDGTEFESVKQLANEILPPNIQPNFKGRQTNKEVLTWYQYNAPNLFLNVSTSEGIPLSIMEAMSFGVPVIATDVGGTSEIVDLGNGILLSVNISNQLADSIKLVLEMDSAKYSELAQGARSKWKAKYWAEKNYSLFASRIKSIA